MPCIGRVAVLCQSLLGTGPKFSWRRDFADEDF